MANLALILQFVQLLEGSPVGLAEFPEPFPQTPLFRLETADLAEASGELGNGECGLRPVEFVRDGVMANRTRILVSFGERNFQL